MQHRRMLVQGKIAAGSHADFSSNATSLECISSCMVTVVNMDVDNDKSGCEVMTD